MTVSLPEERSCFTPAPRSRISYSYVFLYSAFVGLAATKYSWTWRWLLSGAPLVTLSLLIGAANGNRVLAFLPLWTVIATLILAYSISATSWLLYGVFTGFMIPMTAIIAVFQFTFASRLLRRIMRRFLVTSHIVQDTVALFDIPALEIDVDVDGLMVIRGLTISFSTLTVVAHGIEVGIKLHDDMELAIFVDKVTILLLRRIDIGDCFANLKGGKEEMTFGDLDSEDSDDEGSDPAEIIVEDSALLHAASSTPRGKPKIDRSRSQMAQGKGMEDSQPKESWKSMSKLAPDDEAAGEEYQKKLKYIKDTSAITQARAEINIDDEKDERAAICSKLQATPTTPHPPKRSIRVTTLQTLSRPGTRRFMHRLPLLLRLLLNPISYLHPVYISSITASGTGKYISHTLKQQLFKHYSKSSHDLRKIEKRIMSWLSEANFVLELSDISGIASVPVLPSFDIITMLKFVDVEAYRSNAEDELEKIVRIGGADCSFTIPSFLLPHHEHLLPPVPSRDDKAELEEEAEEADGKPKTVQAERKLEQAEKDEANVKISAHVQLPATFSQELLNFVAALVKATKMVDIEKEPDAFEESSGIKEFGKSLTQGLKGKMKKTVVDGVINDRWIAKMVGKVTKQLEKAHGDIGYTGDIPVKLDKYRLPDGHPELQKILA